MKGEGLPRRLIQALHRRIHPPGRSAAGLLPVLWRHGRRFYHRLFHRRPDFLLVLDEPPRLSGFAAITGWTSSPSGRVARVDAIVDGKIVASAVPEEKRPDVQERWSGLRWVAGFRLAPPVDALGDGLYPLTLRATDVRGRTWEIQSSLEVDDYQLADANDLPPHLRGTNREYQHWIRFSSDHTLPAPLPEEEGGQRISIILPVYRPRLDHLREAVASVEAQSYENWDLCICDDGSRQPELTRFLERLSAREPRVRWTAHLDNRGIAAASNAAIRLSSGSCVAFLDQDDRLAANALSSVAVVMQRGPADVIYSDEDRVDERGCRIEPIFKPDWSPGLLLSRMYVGHLCAYRRAFLDRIGHLRPEFDGTQDYELALRAAARTDRIVHIPNVLYHWRLGGHSAGSAFNRLCHERGRQAVLMHAGSPRIRVEDGPFPCSFNVRYDHGRQPPVSILIPTRDNPHMLARCLRSIRRRTDYSRLEILVIDNGSRTPAGRRYLGRCGECILRLDLPFNHSRLNNMAVPHVGGELLLLLNDDTEVLSRGWLGAMVEQALRPEVGAVGALLFYPDGRIQHAGVALGLGPVARPLGAAILHDGLDRGAAFLIRDVSAITGACLMIRRELYLEMGGLDQDELPTSFNDVDLCLRLRKAGYRNVCTPLARLVHYESATRTFPDEERFIRVMRERWGKQLCHDPFWNPNLYGKNGFAFSQKMAPAGQRTLYPLESSETISWTDG